MKLQTFIQQRGSRVLVEAALERRPKKHQNFYGLQFPLSLVSTVGSLEPVSNFLRFLKPATRVYAMQGVGYKEKMLLSNVCEKREATHSNFHSTRKKIRAPIFIRLLFSSGRLCLEGGFGAQYCMIKYVNSPNFTYNSRF